jgi:membrane-associated phospholipid phosphatase
LFKNSAFIVPYLFLAASCSVILAYFSKSQIHIFINRHNSPLFDFIFKYITYLGDLGVFGAFVIVVLLFVSYRQAALFASATLLSGIFVQLLKHSLFADCSRPLKYFSGLYNLRLVEGVTVHSSYSFPSGHSTSAFSIFLVLAMFTRNHYLKFACFTLASLTAFSRVYLSQHFLNDAVAGSLLGVVFALGVELFLNTKEPQWFSKSLCIPGLKKISH